MAFPVGGWVKDTLSQQPGEVNDLKKHACGSLKGFWNLLFLYPGTGVSQYCRVVWSERRRREEHQRSGRILKCNVSSELWVLVVEQKSCIFTQLQNIPVSKMPFPLLRPLTRHLLTLSPQHLQALFCIHRTETSERGRGGIHHTLSPVCCPAPCPLLCLCLLLQLSQ